MPSQDLHMHSNLADSIFDLLAFRTGRPFAARSPGGSDDWSRTIWDLIDTGLQRAFNRRNSGWRDTDRYAGGIIGLADGTTAMAGNGTSSLAVEAAGHGVGALFSPDLGGDRPGRTDTGEDGEDGGGISLLLIELRESEG